MCSQEMYILIEWERQKQMRKRSDCRGTKAAGKGEGVRWGLGAETINRFSLWGWPLHKHLEKKTDWAMRSGRSMLWEEETPGQRSPSWAALCIEQDSKGVTVTGRGWAEDEEEAERRQMRRRSDFTRLLKDVGFYLSEWWTIWKFGVEARLDLICVLGTITLDITCRIDWKGKQGNKAETLTRSGRGHQSREVATSIDRQDF